MKLNPDCIRDILLECEEKCTPYKSAVFRGRNSFVHNGNTYSYEETLYHLRQCSMNNYFSRFTEDWSGNFVVKDLTPIAHEFLANIRHADIWEKTKSIAKKIGVSSLKGLMQLSAKIVLNIIDKQIGS